MRKLSLTGEASSSSELIINSTTHGKKGCLRFFKTTLVLALCHSMLLTGMSGLARSNPSNPNDQRNKKKRCTYLSPCRLNRTQSWRERNVDLSSGTRTILAFFLAKERKKRHHVASLLLVKNRGLLPLEMFYVSSLFFAPLQHCPTSIFLLNTLGCTCTSDGLRLRLCVRSR
ncbi:hypothetical protein GGS26DRAFT_428413 [Hypomontagnella submonticulosa]|nr:hypothetical protein GGS26DRAFT_428413 [Hypomontagnella submonticulosa]